MTEQLYRVCWRNYRAAPRHRREPRIERCPPQPISDAYKLMRLYKEGPDPMGLADYWLEPA